MDRGWLQVRLLGPVDVVVRGVPLPVPGVRRRSVLAVLALHPGTVVSASRLIDLIWDDRPPPTAVNTLQRHASYLRDVLGDRGVIVGRSPGYLLDVPGEATAVARAVRLVTRGGTAADPARRAADLREALEIWRGPALSDVTEVAWLRDQAAGWTGCGWTQCRTSWRRGWPLASMPTSYLSWSSSPRSTRSASITSSS